MDAKIKPLRPTEIIDDWLSTKKDNHLELITDENGNQFYRFNASDKDIADLISKDANTEITRGNVNAYRRRHYFAGIEIKVASSSNSGNGGPRDGSGRPPKDEASAVKEEDIDKNGNIVDYASGYAAVQLLHKMDVARISREWVPNMTGGNLRPEQKARIRELLSIYKKMKKPDTNIEEMRAQARLAAGGDDLQIQEIFESAKIFCQFGKTTKGGGKTSIVAAEFYGK